MRSKLVMVLVVALLGAACARSTARADARLSASSRTPATSSRGLSSREPSLPAPPEDVAAAPSDAWRDPSGVATKLLRAGQGTVHPSPNDCVRVRYTSWTRTGSLHSSTERDSQPLTQCLQRAMPGLVVALQQMVVGETRRVWLPAALTYQSDEAAEPAPKQDLTLDLSLLELLKAPAAPSDLRRPPRTALRTPSGLVLRVLRPGKGLRQALPNQRLKVRLSGWTSQGDLFESTELSGQPASVTRADVVPGVGEGLSLMQVGEKARLWVPAALAFGAQPRRGRPAGDMVYDLELVAIE